MPLATTRLGIDPSFPYPDGRTGAWGYDFDTGELVSPARPDVMSYCRQRFPGSATTSWGTRCATGCAWQLPSAPTPALLLWGGEDAASGPYLEPAFVVDAMPVLPGLGGWLHADRGGT